MENSKTVDDFFANARNWPTELGLLRTILTTTQMVEELKWGMPCYTLEGKNLVGINGFKTYFGLWFYQGALLTDPASVLINAQQGKTIAMRQWRMTSADEIKPKLIRQYLDETMAQRKAGNKVSMPQKSPPKIPPELAAALGKDKALKTKFSALSEGRQRDYAEHISDAKQAATKQRRLDKILPLIKSGCGLHDRYRGS